MSGDRHRDGGHLGDKIAEEIRSTLALLFRQAELHIVDTRLTGELTYVPTGFSTAEPGGGAMPAPACMTFDGLTHRSTHGTQSIRMLAEAVRLATGGTCHWEPVECREPMLSALQVSLHAITFDAMAVRQATRIPIAGLAAGVTKVPAKLESRPAIAGLAPEKFLKPECGQLALELSAITYKVPSALKVLPITRHPVPLHRFSKEMQLHFLRALAGKAQTGMGNIQLKVVYDRLQMNLFQSISQDERGNLLCYPKEELVTGNRKILGTAPVYLIFGSRTDTQEPVRAIVPYG